MAKNEYWCPHCKETVQVTRQARAMFFCTKCCSDISLSVYFEKEKLSEDDGDILSSLTEGASNGKT